MLVLATQTRHLLHQRLRIPHLDLLHTQTHLDILPDQSRRHRVGVVPHSDRAASADSHPPTLLRFQPPRRQGCNANASAANALARCLLRCRTNSPRKVSYSARLAKSRLPTQQQRLLHRFLETPVALFAIAVLMPAGRVGRLAGKSVVRQQGPVTAP